jgi:hypothetical protein
MNCRVPDIVAVSLLIASANFAIAQEDGVRLSRDNLGENGASIWMRRGGRADR